VCPQGPTMGFEAARKARKAPGTSGWVSGVPNHAVSVKGQRPHWHKP